MIKKDGNIYTVYMHINKINGKKYIGITQQNVKKRWQNGYGYINNPHFYLAIKKYGWGNFYHIILFDNLYAEQAYVIEAELIRKYKTQDDNYGYNNCVGGDKGALGCTWSDEARHKFSQSRKGKDNPMYGKHHTFEARQKMSLCLKQRKPTYKAVRCIELNKIFKSLKDAAKWCGVNPSTLSSCLHGAQHTSGGYHWEYIPKGVDV